MGSRRNSIIYGIHALFVVATGYLFAISGLAGWHWMAIIGLPLVLALAPKLSQVSYTLNVRILFPISVGLFCVALYHHFPQLLTSEGDATLLIYGITNDGGGIERELFQVNPVFKDAVSVLYAICVAFMLWKGLSDFDELKHVLYEEVSEVRSIADFSTYFETSGAPERNTPTLRALRQLLFEYLENMLEGNRILTNSKNEDVLQLAVVTVGQLHAEDKNDEIALEEIMKSVQRISVLRSKRAVCIEKRMSPFILGLMLVMSMTMVASFFGKATGEFSIDYVYVFLLPTFYASIFMTLIDLSSPFDGYWSIKLEAIHGVEERLAALLDVEVTEKVPPPLEDE